MFYETGGNNQNLLSSPTSDTGDHNSQQDQYDFGTLSGSDTKRQMHYQNNLNVINSVLLRKLAINKLSR